MAGLEQGPQPAREEPEDGRPHCQWRLGWECECARVTAFGKLEGPWFDRAVPSAPVYALSSYYGHLPRGRGPLAGSHALAVCSLAQATVTPQWHCQ